MDVASMAERMSSAVSAASTASSSIAVAEPPAAEPSTPSTPTPAAEAAPSAPEPDLTFQDDEPELNFEAPAGPAAAPAVAATPESTPPAVPGSEFDNMLPKQVETAFLKTNRGRNLLATYKSERVLKEAPQIDPETGENIGGLGYMPTPEQIKEFHARASDWEASQHEFETDPQSWVVNHFMESGSAIRPGAEQILATLPTAINAAYDAAIKSGDKAQEERAVNAFKSIFQPMAMEYINGLYDRARQIADPAKREQYLNGARTIEFDLTGKFRGDDQLAPPKPEDTLEQERQALRTEREQLQSWRLRNQSEAATQVRNQLFNEIDQALVKDIERAFATADLQNTMKPFAFKAAVDAYKAQIQQAVRQNQFAFRQYNFALSKVGPNSPAETRVAAAQVYRQAAQQAIKNSYRNILKELVDGTVNQNAAARSTAAAAASQTAPSVNGGQAPHQSIVPEARVTRLPGEDHVDFIKRRIAAGLGSAPRR